METLESSRLCRLCGQHSGICINIFDQNENHVKKINAVLPILVHEMDLLPKQMCHRCSYKLEEFHKFYSDCLKTDLDLKSQLSWMRKREVKEHIRVPMVQIENVKIKCEPPDYDIYELDPIVENVNYINSMSSMTFSMNSARNNNKVNSPLINEVNERLTCDNRLTDCAHYKCNYGKRINAKSEAALSINCRNIRSANEVDIDSNPTDSTNIRNNFANNRFNGSCDKLKKRLSRETPGGNVSNILETNEVQEMKIKTEKPDGFGSRSLRPRKKSIDYIGTKRKKSSLIINPANINKSLELKRKSTMVEQTVDQFPNEIPIDKIKKEPFDEVQGRILRPRKFLIDYLSCKRKGISRDENDSENRSRNENVRSKRCKSSSDHKQTLDIEFKVKKEIIADNETTNVNQNNEPMFNGHKHSCVRNLSNLFATENKSTIKVEKDIDKDFSNMDSGRDTSSKSSRKMTDTSKLKLGKGGSKRIVDTNCSPKYLRSHDLRLRNGKVKKSEADQQLSLKSLKKRFLESAKMGRTLDRNYEKKIGTIKSLDKVSTPLKTVNNIKHFCEKCCTSFINKELYMLHVHNRSNTCHFN